MLSLVGQQLGNYRLMSLLGRGGFAEVYLGLHTFLQTLAAIKVLHTHLSDEDRSRFLVEARLIGQLDHPHIVRVLDFGVERGVPFLVMDYAAMGSVRQIYPQGSRMGLDSIVSFVEQCASALQYAHDLGIIHRDVKPENILLKKSYRVLLSDFGIAAATGGEALQQPWDALGTVDYAAPEHLQGALIAASDQYALGVVVYEWLVGRRPFGGDTQSDIARQHLFASPPPLREQLPDLAPDVEQVVLRALAKQPGERFASVAAFAQALSAAAAAPSKEQRPAVLPLGNSIPARRAAARPEGVDLWNVPYRHNPFFTGREDVLVALRAALTAEGVAALAQPLALARQAARRTRPEVARQQAANKVREQALI